MKRRTGASIAALAAGAVIVLAGCAPAADSGDSAGASNELRLTTGEVASFDPTQTLSLPDYVIARNSFDTLVRKDDGGLIAGLATEWESTPTSVLFTLRSGSTCADGTEITPTVVKNSIDYLGSADSASPVSGNIFGPGNAPTVTADDAAGTVLVEIGSPWPDMLTGFSISSSGIICPAGLADPEGLGAGTVPDAASGPYVLSTVEPGVGYTYTLRDDYDAWPEWADAPEGEPASTLAYTVSSDPTAAANMLTAGQLDIAHITPTDIDRIEDSGSSTTVLPLSDLYIAFNERPDSIFAEPALRAAVAQAIDVPAFEVVATDGTGIFNPWFVDPVVTCATSDDSHLIGYDPDAAAPVLDGVTIRFVAPNIVGTNGAGNEFVQESLRALGADVQLENLDVGSWVSRVFTEPDSWDMTIFADLNFQGTMTNALVNWVGPIVADGGTNLGGADVPAATQALADSLVATSAEERCGILRTGITAIVEGAHGVPLVNSPIVFGTRDGYSVSNRGGTMDDQIIRIVS